MYVFNKAQWFKKELLFSSQVFVLILAVGWKVKPRQASDPKKGEA